MTPAGAARRLPLHVTGVLFAVLFAALSVLASVRWWGGEPLLLRCAGTAGYGWAALASAVVAARLKREAAP